MSYRGQFEVEAMMAAPYPKPFPGKYPTRLAIRVKHKVHPFDYTGKPTVAVTKAFQRYVWKYSPPWDKVFIYEFDRFDLIRATRGGVKQSAPFANAFYPLPMLDLSRPENAFVLLYRKLVRIQGRQMYVSPLFFGKKDSYEPYLRNLPFCVQGNLRKVRYSDQELDTMFTKIVEESVKFWTAPKALIPDPPSITIPESAEPAIAVYGEPEPTPLDPLNLTSDRIRQVAAELASQALYNIPAAQPMGSGWFSRSFLDTLQQQSQTTPQAAPQAVPQWEVQRAAPFDDETL